MNKISLVSIILFSALSLQAQPVERETKTIKAEGASQLDIDIDFAAGYFMIRPRGMDEAAILTVEYTPDLVAYDTDYRLRGETGHLNLESDYHHDWDDWGDNDAENEWRLILSTKYPVSLTIDVAASEAEFDFGGIPIMDLNLDMGAASAVIDFSDPNPERLRDMDIDIGASSIDIRNLSNANFEHLSFSSGAASAELDFGNGFSGESTIDLNVGVGSVDVNLPADVAVRIETDDDSWFSSVDFDDLDVSRVRRGVYESDDFADSKNRITIRIDVGMGSVDLFAGR